MIKIIKLGNMPSEIPIEKTCLKCKTLFSFQKEDIQNDRDGIYVICPCCGSFISVR